MLKYPKEAFLLPFKDIDTKDRARKDFKGIEDLVESLKHKGLLHPPVVAQDENGKWFLVAGERRIRAMLILGLTDLPVVTRDNLSAIDRKELELEENIQRKALDWSEQIENLRQLDELKKQKYGEAMRGGGAGNEEKWSTAKTAELEGISKQEAGKQIAFAKLMNARPDIKERVKGLPLSAAIRVAEKHLETEKLERLHASGEIKPMVQLVHMDCLSYVKELKDNSVDLVLIDPPFGISTLEDMQGEATTGSTNYTTQMKQGDNLSTCQATQLLRDLLPDVFRVMKEGAHFYIFFGFDIYTDLIAALKDNHFQVNVVPLVWDKGRTTSVFKGYDYSPCYEPILFGYKPPRSRRLNEPGKTILNFKIINSQDKVHIFQKPQELLQFLIKQSTNIGDTVVDFFAGSGSTLKAALTLGRHGIGCEKDKEHYLEAQGFLSKS